MKKIIGLIIAIAIIIAVVVLLMRGCGFGFGGGKGKNNDNSKVETVVTEAAKKTKAKSKSSTKDIIKITVTGRDYIYDNNKIAIEDLLDAIKEFDKDVKIEITIDDSAAKNTVDELEDALKENGYKNFK